MFKKISWIVALLAALTMVFVGCKNGGPDEPDAPTNVTLILTDNFEWGHGYQGYFNAFDWISGQITRGDTFNISFKVTASRDLEDTLNFGFVDPSEAANYWRPLTWHEDDDPDLAGPEEAPFLRAGQEVTVNLTLTALVSATGSQSARNQLVFMTSGKSTNSACTASCDWTGTHSAIGSGEKGPVTLTFTDFTLIRGEGAEVCCTTCESCGDDCTPTTTCGVDCCLPCCTDCDPCACEDCDGTNCEAFAGTKAIIKVGDASQNITVTTVQANVSYLSDESGYLTELLEGWGNGYSQFHVDFGAGKSIADFSGLKFTFRGVAGDLNTKGINLGLSTTEFTSWQGWGASSNPTAAATVSYSGSGLIERDFTFDISNVRLPTGQQLWVAIALHANATADSPTSYIISNIEFIEGDGTVEFCCTDCPDPCGDDCTPTTTCGVDCCLPEQPGTDFMHNLGAWQMVMTPNQYNPGFSYTMNNKPDLMDGEKVVAGEEYFLLMEFTLSRDIDDDLMIFLVDNSAGAPSWWGVLSNLETIPAADLRAGNTIRKTLEFTATASSSSDAVAANAISFETRNEDKDALDDITFDFTQFVFARGELDETQIPEPPPQKTTFFSLANYITTNNITASTVFAADNFFQPAGATVTWIDNDGAVALKVERSLSWHAIDMKNEGFNFAVGDVVTVKGFITGATAWCAIIQNVDTGGYEARGQSSDASGGGVVTSEYTITATDLLLIQAGVGIRIAPQSVPDDMAVTITDITVLR